MALNENVQWLYNNLKGKGIDLGTPEEFNAALSSDKETQDWAYQTGKKYGFDLGTSEEFLAGMGISADPAQQQRNVSATSAGAPLPDEQQELERQEIYQGLATPLTDKDKDAMLLRNAEQMRRNAEQIAQRAGQMTIPEPSLSLAPKDGSIAAATERMQADKLKDTNKRIAAQVMLKDTYSERDAVLDEMFPNAKHNGKSMSELTDKEKAAMRGMLVQNDPYLKTADNILMGAGIRWEDARRQKGVSWSNVGNGIVSFAKDATRHLLGDMEGTLSFGTSDIRDAMIQRQVLKKIADAEAYDNPEQVLTPQEKVLYDAIATNIAVEIARQNDTSRWSKAGKITADMIPFVVDIMAGNALFKGMGNAARKAITQTVEKTVKNKLAKWLLVNGGDVATSAVESALTATILPRTYAKMYENAAQVDMNKLDMSDDYRLKIGGVDQQSLGKSWAQAEGEQIKEIFTETGGNFRLIGRALIDNPIGKKILKTPFGMVLKRFEGAQGGAGSRFASMTMYHGVLGEWLEELEGAIYDGNLKDFFTADTQLPMLLSFAVPAAFTGGLNATQQAFYQAKYDQAGKRIDKLIDASSYLGPDKNTIKGQILATLYQTPTENLPQAIGICVEQVYPEEYKALMEGAPEKGNKAAELSYALKDYLTSGTVLTIFDPDMIGGQIADVQAHRQQMREQAEQNAQAEVQSISHADGNIYHVGIKGKEGAEGYAFRGDLDIVPNQDGTLSTRGRDLITIKMTDGTVEQVPADEVTLLDAPASAADRVQAVADYLFAQYANNDLFQIGDKVHIMQNGLPGEDSSTIVNITDEGVEVEIIDPNGQPNTTVIPHEQAAEILSKDETGTEDGIVTFTMQDSNTVRLRDMGDGTFASIVSEGEQPEIFTEDELAQAGAVRVDEAPANTGDNGMQTPVFTIPQEDGVTYSQPVKIWQTKKGRILADIKKTYTDKDGNKVTEVVTINPDGSTVTSNATMPLEGYSISGASAETFEGFEIIGFKKLIELPGRQRVIDERDVNGTPIYREQDAVADVQVKGEDGVPLEARIPLIKSEQAPASPTYPTDEEGNPAWGQMEVPQSAQVLYDLYKGNRESAKAYADDQLKEAEKVQKAAAKQASHNLNLAQRLAEEEQNAQFKAAADAAVKYWQDVKLAIGQIKTAEEQAAKEAQQQLLQQAREQRSKTEEGTVTAPTMAERYAAADKIEGNTGTMTLPDGRELNGRYMLIAPQGVTPSHDVTNNFQRSEGYPVTSNGQSINDRDYTSDQEEQQKVVSIAQNFNGNAIKNMPVISDEGLVYNGNGRMMAGQLAALNGTDAAYTQSLMNNAAQYGFTPEQVASIPNARVVFQLDERLPYSTQSLAIFNEQETQTQSNTGKAAGYARKLTPQAVSEVLAAVDGFNTIDAFFSDKKAPFNLINSLINAGIIAQREKAEMVDGDKLSATGRERLSNILFGTVFDNETIRLMGDDAALKNSILRALPQILDNKSLGEFSLEADINDAIRLLYQVRNADMPFRSFVSQTVIAEDGQVHTAAEEFSPYQLLLAEEMSEGGVDAFRDVLTAYNNEARNVQGGQVDIFGNLLTPTELKNLILQRYGKEPNEQERPSAGRQTDNSAESTPASNEPAAEQAITLTDGRVVTPATIKREDFAILGNISPIQRALIAIFANKAQHPDWELSTAGFGNHARSLLFSELPDKKSDLKKVEDIYQQMQEEYLAEPNKTAEYRLAADDVLREIWRRLNYLDSNKWSGGQGAALISRLPDAETPASNEPEVSAAEFLNEALTEAAKGNIPSNISIDESTIRDDINSAEMDARLLIDGKPSNLSVTIFDMSLGSRGNYNPTNLVKYYPFDNADNWFWEKADILADLFNKGEHAGKASVLDESDAVYFSNLQAAMEFAEFVNSDEANSDEVRLAIAEAETDTNPTEAQKKAENYKQGHVTLRGLPITIENPKGSIRRGTDANGKKWEQKMNNTYGKIRRTEGVDGDHIDVFIGPNLTSDKVFVVDQRNVDTGEFDEHKCMLGFDSLEEAQNGYLSNYEEGWQGMGIVTEVTMDEFKKWIDSSHRKTKPFAEYKSVKTEGAASTAMEEPDEMREELAEELRKFDMGERSPMDENLVYDTDDMRNAVTDILKRYNSPRLQAAMDAITATLERQRAAGSEWLDAEDEEQALIDSVREVVGDKATSVEDRSLYEQAKANKAAAERGKPVSKMKKEEILAELEQYAEGNLFDMTPRMAKRIMSLAKKYGKNLPEPLANMADNAALLTGENSIRDTKNAKNSKKSEENAENILIYRKNFVTLQRQSAEEAAAKEGKELSKTEKERWDWLLNNIDRIIDEYKAQVAAARAKAEKEGEIDPGNKIDPDEVREFFKPIGYVRYNVPDYRLYEKALIEALYYEMLRETVASGNTKLVILTGVGGAGKSTATKRNKHVIGLIHEAGLVFDAALNSFDSLQKRIESAKREGIKEEDITVIPVYNNAERAWENTLERGVETGRVLGVQYFLKAFAENAGKIEEVSVNYPAITIIPFNNEHNSGNGQPTTLEAAKAWDYTLTPEIIDKILELYESYINQGRLDENRIAAIGRDLSDVKVEGEGVAAESARSRLAKLVNRLSGQEGGREAERSEVSGRVRRPVEEGGAKTLTDAADVFPPTKRTTKKEEPKANFENNTLFTADAVAEARKRLAARRNRLNMGLNPEDAYDYTIIAGAYVEQGVRKFADFCKAMIQDLGDAVRPYLQSIYDSLRHDPQVKAQGWNKDFDSHDVVDNFDVDNFDYKERNMPEVRDYKDVNGQDIHIDDVSMSRSGKLFYDLTVTEPSGHKRQTNLSIAVFNHELETKGIYPANEQPAEEETEPAEERTFDSPMFKQFKAIKEQYPDAMLLFRVGDFYELYASDAEEASKILGITLTKRGDGMAFAGFPFHALDTYLPKLVRAGKRVAICDQLENPKEAKKEVKRGVMELVTPGKQYQEPAPEVQAEPQQVVTDTVGEITESKHTKTGASIWVVKPMERVGDAEFRALRKRAKENNGYYSTFVKGYVFNSVNDANRFNNISDVQTTTEQGRADSGAAISTAEAAIAEAEAIRRDSGDTSGAAGELGGESVETGVSGSRDVELTPDQAAEQTQERKDAIQKIDEATERIDKQLAELTDQAEEETPEEEPAPTSMSEVVEQAKKRQQKAKQRKQKLEQTLDLFAEAEDSTPALDEQTEPINTEDNGRTEVRNDGERESSAPQGRTAGQPADQNGTLGGSQRQTDEGTQSGGVGSSSEQHRVHDGERGLGTAGQRTEQQPIAESERKNTHNFRYDPSDPAPTSNKARYDANMAAIRLLKQLQDEGRQATPEEQRVLAKFTGWGGLGEYFKGEPGTTYYAYNGEKSPYQIIKELLTDEELAAAQLSRNSAYYTPTAIIDQLWNIAERLGFKGGNILEGSAGIGNILAQMPQSISDRSNLQAVEIDDITAGILAQLYPDAETHHSGFEKVDIPNNSQDLVITNVPFVTGLRVHDPKEKDLSKRFRSIHDFCIAKNVRKLRQGGIGIFITTSGTLDNSKDLRAWLNTEGETDVIGAFRLNRETFGGTSATSDIIVVRKRVNGQQSPNAINVLDTAIGRIVPQEQDNGKTEDRKLIYNRYFVEHPENMGGEMGFGFEHGDTRWGGTTAGCYAAPYIDQSDRLQFWAKNIPTSEELPTYKEVENGAVVPAGTYETYEGAVPYGSLIINSKGQICRAYHGSAIPVEGITPTKVKGHEKSEVLKDYNALKAAVEELLRLQSQGVADEGLNILMKKLNKAYDDFVKKYGYLNRNVSLSFLRNDVQWASMAALENVRETIDRNGKKKVEVTKTDVFSKRVVGVQPTPKADNAKDGVILSVQQYGNVRPDRIAEWLGKPQDEVEKEIIASRLAFRDPQTGNMVVSHEYLSGNVREKLAYAEEHNENGEYDTNIEELRKVIPVDIPAHLIEFNIGSTWIPVELYHEYLKEKFGVDSLQLTHVGSAWLSNEKSWGTYSLHGEKNRSEGVYSEKLMEQVYGHQLMIAAMNNVPVVVSRVEKHTDGSTETITDKAATAACSDKISQIKDDFVEWARGKMQEDSELAERVQKIYNERFNAIVPMLSVDKAFLSPHLPGQNSDKYDLYNHQQQAVVRGTTQPIMLAHEVGTGKTITLISTAMEMRRLGTAKKPMIVVQNATTPQFVKEAKDLYPNAKILTVSERDRTKEGRQEFYAKIKYNDWDLIIVPQSVFDMIPDSEARMRDFIQDKIDEKLHAIEAAKEAKVDEKVTKRMERELEALKEDLQNANMSGKKSSGKKSTEKDAKKEAERIANATAQAEEMLDRRTDEVEDFDDMGIDALLIDEAHNYKHLGFATMMTRGVKGIDPSYSKRAAALFLKCQSIYDRKGHRNVVFATGTPISNTAAEIWTFMKYLMPKEVLKENDIYYFDDFVHNFGKIAEQLEFATNGKFKANNRFAQYGNVPELMRLWLTCADCVLTREVGQVNDKVPELEGGKAQDIFLPQSPSLIDIMASVREELDSYEHMSGKEKKENSHIPLTMYGVAKRAAIDPRLVDASAADEPLSKTNKAVEETLRSLKETKKYNGTVAIFCDSYRNLQTGFNLFEDIKAKLVKAGVPAAKIAIIRSEMTDAAKQKIFDAVREGEIRVIMGSTQTLGTGVNIQTRLHTLIHMDAPDRPMDYTQRNGRIIRQGNMHRQWNIPVRVLRFGVEDSLDVTSYQRLKTKAGFIDSIMNGKSMIDNNLENRVIEDVEEGIFDNPVAMLSGSQYALLKSQAERDLRKWQARKQQHDIDQILIAKKLRDNAQIIEHRRQLIATDEQFLEQLKQAFPEGKVTEYNINGTVCHSDKELKEALKAVNKDISDQIEALHKRGYEGERRNIALALQFNGMTFNVNVLLTKRHSWKADKLIFVVDKDVQFTTPISDRWIDSPTKVIDKLVENIEQDYLSGTQATGEINYSRSYISRLQQENELMRQREGKPFEHGAELEKAQALVDEYTEKMQDELAEKEAKYANMSSGRAVTLNEQDDEEETPEAQIDNLDYPQFTNQTEAQQLATAALVEVLNDNTDLDVFLVTDEEAQEIQTNTGEFENDVPEFSIRREAAPKKTGIGYKVFYRGKDGKLYPPMVANPNGADTPVGVWLNADAAPVVGETKTGRPQVKAGGKGTQGGSGTLAYRPGWHLGEIPYALQFNRKDENGEKTLFPKDFVWAEVEYAADVDYQQEANEAGINKNGNYEHAKAGLKHLPTNGYYRYRTNPNPETDPWIITGAMKVNRVLTNEEVDDIVRAAGREPQRREGDVPEFSIVNHNSPYLLKKADGSFVDPKTGERLGFDHRFIGEGEGYQSHGYGTYVSAKDLRDYANSKEWLLPDVEEVFDAKNLHAAAESYMHLASKEGAKSFKKWLEDRLERSKSNVDKYKGMSNIEIHGLLTPDEFMFYTTDKFHVEIIPSLLASLKKDFDTRVKHHYDVEIPNNDGTNYIEEDAPMDDVQMAILRNSLEHELIRLDREQDNGKRWGGHENDIVPYLQKVFPDGMKGHTLYYNIGLELGHYYDGERNDKVASEFLNKEGYVGIHYFGGRDGECYVIFNENDAKIINHRQFMRTPNGTLYGWAIGDRIYLTKAGLNPNTPIHEYTHLWAKAMRRNNQEGWQSIVNIFKGTPFWDEVVNDPNYQGLTTDDAICSEVLARYSGTRGAARMEEAAAEMLHEADQTDDLATFARTRRLISRVRQALSDFWHWVGVNLFGIKHFNSTKQVADRVLFDMLNGTELKPEDQTTTNNFKAWFGDWQNDPEHASKVVDKKGRPLVVYHGSPYTFTEFRAGRPIYAFNKRNLADQYRHRRGNLGVSMRPAPESSIVEGYINLRNPFIFEVHGAHYRIAKQYVDYQLHGTPYSYGDKPEWISADDVVKMVQEDGRYDGVIFKDMYDNLFSTDKVRGDIYVAFSPNQIKSATNNSGEFSSEDNDIERSVSKWTPEQMRAIQEWNDAHPHPQYQVGEKLDHYAQRLSQWEEARKQFRASMEQGRTSSTTKVDFDEQQKSVSPTAKVTFSNNETAPSFTPGVKPTPTADESPAEYALRLKQYYQLMRDDNLVADYVAEINAQADAAAKGLKKNTLVRGLLDAAKPIENFQEWMAQRGATMTDGSNAYTDTFLASGRVSQAHEQLTRDILRPLAKQIATIIAPDKATGKSRLDGINITWQNMDVPGTGSKIDGKALTPREIIGVYCQAKDCAEAIDKGLPDRGAKGFERNLGMTHDQIISEVESRIPRAELDEMWRLINAATHFALNYDYESGRISEDTHTEFYQREFYVPQRGWRERDESALVTEYEPVGKRGHDPYNAALVKAHGRQSLAADPFAYIMSIDASSIISSENNKIKQKFLRFCLDNEDLGLKTGAFRIKKYWIMNVIDPETGRIKLDADGNPMMEVSYSAPSTEDLQHDKETKQQIQEKRKQLSKVRSAFEKQNEHGEMPESLQAAYETKIARLEQAIEDLENQMHIAWHATNTNISQRTSDEKKQHEVQVLLDGEKYVIELQDEKLANAINKKFKQHQESLFDTTQKMRNATRFMSAMLTQYNPEFAASNFARDYQVALATLMAEHRELVEPFMKYFATCQGAVWKYAFNDKVRDREAFANDEMGQYLREYFASGAPTGFSYMQDLKSLRRDFDAMVNESVLRHKGITGMIASGFHSGIKGAVGLFATLTEVSETAVRFAGFVAARKNGMGINEAAYLSKELTTNFDRAGEVADTGWISWFSFFRATLNGNIKFLKALKKMPLAYSLVAVSYFAMGMLNQFLNPDDPDDEIWASDYTRMSNFVIGKWRIPTGHFLRMFFAAGVNAAQWIQGNKTFGHAVYNTATFATDELLPDYLDVMKWTDWNSKIGRMTMPWDGDNYKKGVRGFIPTPLSPVADVWANRDFMGATINYPADEGTKDILRAKKKTLPVYQWLTQFVYEDLAGGDMNTRRKSADPAWRSWLFDNSASSVEHIVEGYMPAGMDMFITTAEAIYDAAHGIKTSPDKWPFVRKFYNAYTPERAYMQQYYLLKDRVEEFERTLKDYQKNDPAQYRLLRNSQEYRTYQQTLRLVKSQSENPTTADVQALIEANKQWIK